MAPPPNTTKSTLNVGLLAHVDAGKTTLSEALLYTGGRLRTLGRVDHGSTFLDTFSLERERGITIFSKQASLPLEDLDIQLLDTPGHVDFSAEMERTLQVLDCAVLVISGTDGVQAHTRTLWQLLDRYHIPTFLFVNKMDLAGADREALTAALAKLDSGCVDFTQGDRSALFEQAALGSEAALEEFLETGALRDGTVRELIARRAIFPCWFGSALKLDGVEDLLEGLRRFAPVPHYGDAFGARVYKISRDNQGSRLTWLKVTGGTLRVKTLLTNRRPDLRDGQVWEEKADQLRLYSGDRFRTADEAPAGTICAVTGLSRTVPGEGLGSDPGLSAPVLEPVQSCQVLLPEGVDPHTALVKLRELEEEDPQLHIVWNEQLRQIHLQLMGEVQLEILQELIAQRFGMAVHFGPGSIVYKETIAAPVEGAGHFEPLRHYAEVHLLLEPGRPGSGLVLDTCCSEDQLDRNWQRLILTHLAEKEHRGVLVNAPLTDVKITLTAGRAHVKHTEGGDFRQATYRAVRQALMKAESVLLEPWYDLRLELPADQVGRAISDLQRRGGSLNQDSAADGEAVLTGAVPVSAIQGYASELAAYTRGLGRMFCTLRGYAPCHNAEAVIADIAYDPERDTDDPADSVFCAHGGGYLVRWDEADDYMHVSSGLRQREPEPEQPAPVQRRPSAPAGSFEEDKELRAIFERTYGQIKRRDIQPTPPSPPRRPETVSQPRTAAAVPQGPDYLLVDGYNIIFAWDELKTIAREHLDTARKQLLDLLCNYQGFKKCVVIVVFDAYKVKGNPGSVEKYHNLHVVYTKEAETADAYIERTTYEIGRKHRVRVATSDGPEQLIILGHGALRLSAAAFHEEVLEAQGQIDSILTKNNRGSGKTRSIQAAMEKARKKPD